MNYRIRNYLLVASAGLLALLPTATLGIINCNTTQVVSSNLTLNDNYERTTGSISPCIRVEGTNTVLNMGGHTITCKDVSGCGRAVQVHGTTATARNGNIVSGTGNWNIGVNCFTDGLNVYNDCVVDNVYIENTTTAAVQGGKTIGATVMVNTPICIDSEKALTSTASISQNYCSASTVGIVVTGPSSGSPDVERNFVRATDVSGTGIHVLDGNVDIIHNIIDASTPIDDTTGDVVNLTENICSDSGDCPDPTTRGFSLSLDFN